MDVQFTKPEGGWSEVNETRAFGRNRSIKCQGLSIIRTGSRLMLMPITTRGTSTSAVIEIPLYDVDAVCIALRDAVTS